MGALLDLFLDICLLRKGPQDLPSSPALLKASLAAYALASLAVQAVSVSPLTALFQAFLDLGLLVGLTYAVLHVLDLRVRFTQTLTALAGTGALLGFAILPVTIWMDRDIGAGVQSGLPALLFLGWLVWSIAVVAHVLRHALSTSIPMALLYTLGYLAISVAVATWLFPEIS